MAHYECGPTILQIVLLVARLNYSNWNLSMNFYVSLIRFFSTHRFSIFETLSREKLFGLERTDKKSAYWFYPIISEITINIEKGCGERREGEEKQMDANKQNADFPRNTARFPMGKPEIYFNLHYRHWAYLACWNHPGKVHRGAWNSGHWPSTTGPSTYSDKLFRFHRSFDQWIICWL